jgi:hypothetical protein
MKKAQVVMVRSNEGFCDRLRVLNQALLYCLRYSAVLCVDWEDAVWDVPFESIFALTGITYAHKAKVVDMIEAGATLSSLWTLDDVKTPLNELIARDKKYKGLSYTGGYCGTERDVRFQSKPPKEEILVTNGHGLCLNEFRLLCMTLRFKGPVRDAIVEKLESMPDRYTMIHLRGTDRSHSDFLPRMMEGFRGLNLEGPTYVIGDDVDMIDAWLREFPECREFRPNSSIRKLGGRVSHKMTSAELTEVGLTKQGLHLETLLDFFGLLKATDKLGMKSSYFFDTAQQISNLEWTQMLA